MSVRTRRTPRTSSAAQANAPFRRATRGFSSPSGPRTAATSAGTSMSAASANQTTFRWARKPHTAVAPSASCSNPVRTCRRRPTSQAARTTSAKNGNVVIPIVGACHSLTMALKAGFRSVVR